MLKNYFVIAWRNIQRNKGYTLLNITGLAFGLAAFIVALLYINHENGFDKWDKQLSRVYRIDIAQSYGSSPGETTMWSPYPLGTALTSNCPEIQSVTRIADKSETLIDANGKQLYVNSMVSADSAFFTVFPYKFVYGTRASALNKPGQAALSLAISRKFFGDADPVGKTITLNGGRLYTVSGVFEPTGPSHLDVSVCLSLFNKNANWNAGVYFTYALLKPEASVAALCAKALQLQINGMASYTYTNMVVGNPKVSAPGEDQAKWLKDNSHMSVDKVLFEPVANIHLSPKATGYSDSAENHPLLNTRAGNVTPVIFFSIASVLVLLLACINYTNLSIARAGKRAKEAGIRKVMGADRLQLMKQFLAEAFVQCLAALLLALFLAKWVIYLMNSAFNMQLSFYDPLVPMQNLMLAMQVVLLVLLVTLVSGAYPAFILSSFRPVKVLKGEITKNVKGKLLRNGFVVLQFAISTCFIIGMLVVYKQLDYVNAKDPGFSTAQVMVLNSKNDQMIDRQSPMQKIDLIKDELMRIPGVKGVAVTDFYPGTPSLANKMDAKYNNRTSEMTFDYVHFDYFKVLGMKLVEGRDFSKNFVADTVNSAIINETAASYMGYKDPVGQQVNILNRDYNIIGVVRDSHVAGYNSTILPEVYAIGAVKGMLGGYRAMLVKVNGRDAAATASAVQAYWKTFEPGFPLRYTWLDKDFVRLLDKYERFGKLTILLSVVSMAIALMGIFALSAFAAAQRTKEIGIRKVFGASVVRITAMLSSDFLRLIIIALVIAFPLAYWGANKWLQEFAYRIELNWLIFLFAGLSILTIALVTVSLQTIKAAVVNPVESLKAE